MWVLIFSWTVAVCAAALGVLGLRGSPRQVAHVSFGVGMLVLAVETLLTGFSLAAPSRVDAERWQSWRLIAMSVLAAPWLTFSLCYSRGDSRQVLRRWWPALAVVGVLVPLLALIFRDALLVPGSAEPAPSGLLRLGPAGVALEVVTLLAAILILANLERTFRHAVGLMRWRIKFMVLGVGVVFLFRLYHSSLGLLFGGVDERLDHAVAGALLMGCILMSVALARGRIFDVEVYPSHKFVFGSLTILLAGAYLLAVGVFAQVLTSLRDDYALPLKALIMLVGLAGLAALLLSERLRQRLRQFVSRHLRRSSYDYRKVWSSFATRTTSLVDEWAFSRAVAAWVSETFHVLSASVWVLAETKDRLYLGASTSLPDSAAEELEPDPGDLASLLGAIGDLRDPIDIEQAQGPWMAAVRRLHPGSFARGGHRICMPLRAGDELLGLLVLGDRVSGLPFTAEDVELLKCVGDQVGSSLLGLQLSRRLIVAKEMEAFQTMSAFFVHDLKNTASTLSLTLQNLETHFADPAFRDDALRAVGKSAAHIQSLIARLSQLRQELRIEPAPARLVEVVESALSEVGPFPGVEVRKSFQLRAPLALDRDQMQKVLVNVLLNAREAIGQTGEIRVETGTSNGWAVLSVTDNGCGMSPEFLRRSLFRPFHTTKKNGLGIGMFHSRMIVHAHRGRIEVESTPGQGTTVRILLPFPPDP